MNIYQKLLTIQKKIHGLGKDKAGNNYRYVTGDKVLGEIKPLMDDLGLLLKQEAISLENTRQDYMLKSGTSKSEILSRVGFRFTWVDCETGEKDENLFFANGQNDWDKGFGSACTYAERYFLLKFFHIATDEDDIDNPERAANSVNASPTKKEPAKVDPPSKPFLAKGSEQWKGAVDFMLKGGSISDIKKKYQLLEPNENELIELTKK